MVIFRARIYDVAFVRTTTVLTLEMADVTYRLSVTLC